MSASVQTTMRPCSVHPEADHNQLIISHSESPETVVISFFIYIASQEVFSSLNLTKRDFDQIERSPTYWKMKAVSDWHCTEASSKIWGQPLFKGCIVAERDGKEFTVLCPEGGCEKNLEGVCISGRGFHWFWLYYAFRPYRPMLLQQGGFISECLNSETT